MPEFKEQVVELTKKHGLDMKVVQPILRDIVTQTKLSKMEKSDQEAAILAIIDISGTEKIEFMTAFLLWDEMKKSDIPIKDVIAKFRKFVSMDHYKAMPKDQAERLASKAVKADIIQEKRLQTKPFNIVVLGKSIPKKIKVKKTGRENMMATVAAYCKIVDGVDTPQEIQPFYRSIMLWGDQSKKAKDLIIGHQYQVEFARNMASNQLDAWGPVDRSEFEHKGKFMGNVTALLSEFKNVKLITLNEAEFHISQSVTDNVMVKCDIVGRMIRDTSAMYFIVDDTIDDAVYGGGEKDNPTGGFTVFMDPSNMIYDSGSEVYMIGRMSKRTMKDGRESIAMSGDAVIPILTIPVGLEPVESEEQVNMKSEDETVVDPKAIAREMGNAAEDLEDMFTSDVTQDN